MTNNIKILIATDFTEAADNALNYTDALFRNLYGLEVTYVLVHAFKPLVPYTNTPSMPVMSNHELEKELQKKLENLTSDFQKKQGDQNMVKSYFKIGAVREVLEEIASDEKPDLIVMGTREKSAFERMAIGTNTLDVASAISCPVLAIPKEAKATIMANLVLASDMDDFAISPLSYSMLKRLVNRKESRLQVLHVFSSEKEAEESESFDQTAVHDRLIKLDHKHVAIVEDDLPKGIISYVNEHQSDLLALALSEQGFLEKIFHTSKTEKMLYHAQVPVLLLN